MVSPSDDAAQDTELTFESILKGAELPSPDWATSGERDLLPELFIAFARPQGTDARSVKDKVEKILRDTHHYWVETIDLAELLRNASFIISGSTDSTLGKQSEGYERTLDLMRMGDAFRTREPSNVAMLAVCEIHRRRPAVQLMAQEKFRKGIVYFIHNLMHESEVSRLRSIYKQRFFLVAIHQPRVERLHRLMSKYKKEKGVSLQDATSRANHVIDIDAGLTSANGSTDFNPLNVNETFQHGDVFLPSKPAANSDNKIIERWTQQVFGYPWGAPTDEEFGMATAYLSARRSVALGRSVGAAILDANASIVAIGWNETARAGGGVSHEGQSPDLREHAVDPYADSSDVNRIAAIEDFLDRLLSKSWEDEYQEKYLRPQLKEWLKNMRLAAEKTPIDIDENLVKSMARVPLLRNSRLFSLIEFGRSVHAEMAAITDAARRGVSVANCTMYITTFPCHECSRNIVAAGIEKVVYVEPYPKSMSYELYGETTVALGTEAPPAQGEQKVKFEQYSGISPKRFDDLFSAVSRKHSLNKVASDPDLKLETGGIVTWDPLSLRPSIAGYYADKVADRFFEVARLFAEHSNIVNFQSTIPSDQ